MSEESYPRDDLEVRSPIVEGSRRRQMGKHILHMWEEGPKYSEEVTRSLIVAIGRAMIAQEADKARLLTVVGVRVRLRPCWSASSHRTTSKGEGVIPIG
jgi:hypothetical protein